MHFRALPEQWIGKKVVQISDLHVGPQVSSEYLRRCLGMVSALEPELTLITGDFMTAHGSEMIDEAARVMEVLKPGARGCYACLGNHDYGHRWNNRRAAGELVRRLEGLNVKVLRNESREVEGLQITGLDDVWAGMFDPGEAFAGVDWEKPAITLCHNPDGMDAEEMSVCRGWILAGHTHGGQCKPPFLPPPILPVQNRKYTAGEIDVGEGRRLYINRGLGHLRKVRFNVRPEITVFQLERVAF